MMKKYSTRAAFCATLICTLIATMALAAGASANAVTTATVTYANPQLGAHSDVDVSLAFNYGDPIPANYPAGSNWRETLKNLVVDTPAGLIGNPNAVPMADRCEPTAFYASACPASSVIGTINIDLSLFSQTNDPAPTDDGLGLFLAPTNTQLVLLKTGHDVPATIGIRAKTIPSVFPTVYQTIQIVPDTKGDFKLRTTTNEPIVHDITRITDGTVYTLRVDSMDIKFNGILANGNAFMTNPMSCTDWTTNVWEENTYVNSDADSDPLGTGTNTYKKAAPSTTTPDCTNQSSLPFPIVGTTKISAPTRDVSPDFDFTVTEPGVQANGQASTTAKSVVTTVPAAINVDFQQLGRLCERAAFDADNCAASTKVGTMSIDTPLIAAGLTGNVYLVRGAPGTVLPDLGLQIHGEINFTQLGTNKFVGPNGNQIQTTFDNIPQVGFSRLNVHLFGGPNGLLRTLACPSNNQQPADGNFTYNFTSYTGSTTSSTTKLNAAGCFGIQKLKTFKCVYRQLRFQPTYTSRARIKRVVLKVDRRRVATSTHTPFQFRVPADKFKKGKHRIDVAATYDDGTVSKKTSRFRRC